MTEKRDSKKGREALGKGMGELAEEAAKRKIENETSRLMLLDSHEDMAAVCLSRLMRKSFAQTIGDRDALASALKSLADLRKTLVSAAKAKLDEDVRQAEQGRRTALEELARIEEEKA